MAKAQNIKVGMSVTVSFKRMKRGGIVTRSATKRTPNSRGLHWWIKLYGTEPPLHVVRAEEDIEI